jgi:hypothetical protein
MFCKVQGCPHASFHVTADHFCRICQQTGHGRSECYNPHLKQALAPFLSDVLPTTHHCAYPGCPRAQYHISEYHFCKECKHLVPCAHFTFGPAAIRTRQTQTQKEADGTSLICPVCRVKNFIPSQQARLYHDNPATCSVCYENPVTVFLPACGHAKLCEECVEKLRED